MPTESVSQAEKAAWPRDRKHRLGIPVLPKWEDRDKLKTYTSSQSEGDSGMSAWQNLIVFRGKKASSPSQMQKTSIFVSGQLHSQNWSFEDPIQGTFQTRLNRLGVLSSKQRKSDQTTKTENAQSLLCPLLRPAILYLFVCNITSFTLLLFFDHIKHLAKLKIPCQYAKLNFSWLSWGI